MFSRAAQKGIRRDPFTALHQTAALWKRIWTLTGFLHRVIFIDFTTFSKQSQLINHSHTDKIHQPILCNISIRGGRMYSLDDIGLDTIIVSRGQARSEPQSTGLSHLMGSSPGPLEEQKTTHWVVHSGRDDIGLDEIIVLPPRKPAASGAHPRRIRSVRVLVH